MKKIILLALIAISSTVSFAQFQFGAQVGANFGMGHSDYDNNSLATAAAVSLTNDPKVGFLIGVLGEVGFGKIAFRPELNFIQKGSKYGGYGSLYGYGITSDATKRTLNYVELPLNVVYNLKLAKAGKVFFGLGPAIGIGLSGTDKGPIYDNNTGNYVTGKAKIKFDGKKTDVNAVIVDPDNHLKRTDIGLNILAGFQFSMGVFAKIGYTYGFSNIDPNKDVTGINTTYKNRGVSICIGYMIGKK